MIKKVLKYFLIGSGALLVFLFVLGSLIGTKENEKKFNELIAQGYKYLDDAKYGEAQDAFRQALKIKDDNTVKLSLKTAEDKLQEAQKKSLYSQRLESGIKLLENKEYVKALEDFKGIPSEDSEHYPIAQQKIKEILPFIAQKELASAKDLFSKKDYIGAFAELNNALEHNPDLAEAKTLLATYKKQKDLQEEREQKEAAQQVKQAAVDAMKTYTSGVGPVQIAVSVKTVNTFNGKYSTNGKSWFVQISVNARNTGKSTAHVNPLYFTLSTPDGYTVNPDTDMYSLSNYLEAVDLNPDNYTTGWLVFFVPKEERYTLHYKSMDSRVDKNITL